MPRPVSKNKSVYVAEMTDEDKNRIRCTQIVRTTHILTYSDILSRLTLSCQL